MGVQGRKTGDSKLSKILLLVRDDLLKNIFESINIAFHFLSVFPLGRKHKVGVKLSGLMGHFSMFSV